MVPVMSRYKIDWAIHAAFVVPVLRDKSVMEDIDINGTRNFFDACGKLDVRHVIHLSSTTAYGAHKDNPSLLTEECELRGNEGFTYGKSKSEIELGMARNFMENNPDTFFTIARPCFVCGPHFYKNPLGRHLMKKIIPLPRGASHFQYVHEDDVADGVYFLLKNNLKGAFNLAGDGTMTFEEMAEKTNAILITIPADLMYRLNDLAWFFRMQFITEFPSEPMALLTCPWIADNSKIKNAGYKFKYTTREAFSTFAEQVRNYRSRCRN